MTYKTSKLIKDIAFSKVEYICGEGYVRNVTPSECLIIAHEAGGLRSNTRLPLVKVCKTSGISNTFLFWFEWTPAFKKTYNEWKDNRMKAGK